MRYIVTGAAGFIGSHLSEELLRQGHEVVGLDCFTDYYDVRLKKANAGGIDVRRIDLAEDDLDFAGFDGVFHLAGQPGVRSFGEVFVDYVRRNILASQRVFEAAVRGGARVVFASTSSIYGDAETYPTTEDTVPQPVSPYGVTKLACEHLVEAYRRAFDLDCAVLRYFSVYGPRQRPDMAFTRIANALARGHRFELYGDGEQSRGFTYVADAVDASILTMERGTNTIYNVGGVSEATMNQVIAIFEEIAGVRLDLVRIAAAKGDVRRTNADTTRVRELGWVPRISLEDGLRNQFLWAQARLRTNPT